MALSSEQHLGFSVPVSGALRQSEASIIPTIYSVMEGQREKERAVERHLETKKERKTKRGSDRIRRTDKVTKLERWVYKKHA